MFVNKLNNREILIDKKNDYKQSCQNIPIYTINYQDSKGSDAGYAVVIGDQRFNNKILKFNNVGRGGLFNGADSLFWMDRVDGYLHSVVNGYIKNDIVNGFVQELQNNQDNYFYYDADTRTRWHQRNEPYTLYTRFVSGQRALAGCTAVAMGEIMAFHEWPVRGAYRRQTTSTSNASITANYQYWNEVKLPYNPYSNSYVLTDPNARNHVGNLLAEIGYKLDTNYGLSVSLAKPRDAIAVFEEMGYKRGQITLVSYSSYLVRDQIKRNLPVFMYGYSDTGGGHAFVVDKVITYLEEPVFIYIKSGEGGVNDGYYNQPSFNLNGTINPYKYRYNCGLLINIEPDYNNSGSINAGFKVGNEYIPY